MSEEKNTLVPEWYAIYTKARAEKRVQAFIENKGFEAYLPLAAKRNDKNKITSYMPLIPSYVFMYVEMNHDVWYEITNSSNVVKFIEKNNFPIAIPEHEIESLKLVVEKSREVSSSIKVENIDYQGKLVKILEGPFSGVVGRVQQIKQNRKKIVINIENIAASISVEVDTNLVEKVESYSELDNGEQS